MRKYTCNSNYFSKQTLQSCYWAGFIAADGCINNKSNNSLEISLSIKDLSQLKQFKKDIKFTGNIYKSEKFCRVAIYDKKLIKDLKILYNIIPNKTKKYDPTNIKTNSKNKNLAFIIGYLDGDGSVFKTKTKTYSHKNGYTNTVNSYLVIDFAGTEKCLNFIRLIIYLEVFKIFSKSASFKNVNKITKIQGSNSFRVSGKKAEYLYNYLKTFIKNSNIKTLKRKWSVK